MNFWTGENLRSIVGGSWLALPATGREPAGLSTDTRTLRSGEVFLAIRGERVDGHAMAGAAGAAGSPMAIVDNPQAMPTPFPPGMGVLKVADTGRALLKLAAAYRKSLEGTRVIAVCGSNGKTTTVRLIESMLSQALRGTASPRSFNNAVGVPLTILSARPGDQYLICEIGTNAPGEIAQLAAVVNPDVAVITSIGREHLEKLGSLRGVAMEEASVLEFVRPGGAGVVHAEAPELLQVVAEMPQKPNTILRFGESEQADVRVTAVEQSGRGVRFTLNDRTQFTIPLIGRHNAVNAAAAVAVGRRLGLQDEQIAGGLARVRGADMRLEPVEVGGVRILNDAYNANPDSMRAALATFESLAVQGGAPRRVLILGNMLELGDDGPGLHAEIGEAIAAMPWVDLVVLVGDLMQHAAARLGGLEFNPRVVRTDNVDGERATDIARLLRPGDLVLLKGSRGMRLERVVTALKQRGIASEVADVAALESSATAAP
jgi:UDP-N-acetylmuramoyl-tripeptide--D-alanyl-D-alanine ligase